MEKPKLVLHIGLNKTGTTTIQHSLMVNEPGLRDAGFHLPDRLGREDGGHHKLVAILKEKGAEAFVDHIRKDNTSPVTVVSAESFLLVFEQAPARIQRLSKALKPWFDTHIILFLRRQDYLKESVFAQVAKHHFRGTIQQHDNFLYDFDPYVEKLEKSFGQSNVKIVIYRDDQRFDSWAAFCLALGISADDYPVSTALTNSSLPRRKTLALSMMPKASRGAAIAAINVINRSDCIRDDRIKFLMSPDERRQFLRNYLEGNRRICDRHNPAGSEFFCSDEMPAGDWYPADPISPAEWANFAGELALEIASRRRVPAKKPPVQG